MQFAVNYSPLLAEMVRAGEARVDRLKIPAWPAIIAEARATLPVYIHFPLDVGWGRGQPLNSETHAVADLGALEELMAESETPYINTHIFPGAADYADIPVESREDGHARRVADGILRDLEPLITHFGAEKVLVENTIGEHGRHPLGVTPGVIRRVVEVSGCGFLFDIAHARLSARVLGMDEKEYIEGLPLERMREMHVTGIQRIEGRWLELMRAAGDPNWSAEKLAGMEMEHLPMTESDWGMFEWSMGKIHAGEWGQPWVVAFEVGGVGGFWSVVGDAAMYREQLPRLRAGVRGGGAGAVRAFLTGWTGSAGWERCRFKEGVKMGMAGVC